MKNVILSLPLLLLFAPWCMRAADVRYLRYSPDAYRAMVPRHVPAPVTVECAPFSTSGFEASVCPFCGKKGSGFRYDFLADPEKVVCVTSGRDLRDYATIGSDTFTDWRGQDYVRRYFETKLIPNALKKGAPVKVFPENIRAREKIVALLGRFGGSGALLNLANGYAETCDERYAERAIAILEGFANVFPAWPWTCHSAMKPLTRRELTDKAKIHDSGYHGWMGPARLASGMPRFRNPEEALYFANIARAYRLLEKSASWNGRREKIRRDLLEEGALHFRAYGAKQCVANAIGMYAPALYELGRALNDKYLLDGFDRIMEDFLYNENHYDGISTEGSIDYARMVGGMWGVFRSTGLVSNDAYRAKHPFLAYAGKTEQRLANSFGGMPALGDQHMRQYDIRLPAARDAVGEECGGWGLSVLRAGSRDKRLDLYFSHDRCSAHSHDDTLGLQFFYRGVPLLEQFGDTRDTVDLNEKIPNADAFAKLAYPARIVMSDPRKRGFNLQDMTTGLTKNLVIVDDYWSNNGWYTAYKGGHGDRREPYGQLNARTGRVPESDFQFVEAEARDMNAKSYQGMDDYRRAICVVTRPDGTPYVVDFFTVCGGHRHLFLLHSRGREVFSTLGRGETYDHLEDVPRNSVADSFVFSGGSILFPSNVLNNVVVGPAIRGAWRHAWEFDYAAWASKSHPPAKDLLVKPQRLDVWGFLSPRNGARAIRADGHYPVTIEENVGGVNSRYRFQFENAVHYAGLRSESDYLIKDTYVQLYAMRGTDEPECVRSVRRMEGSDGATAGCAALSIAFADGTEEIVAWNGRAQKRSWDGGRLSTDARAAFVRLSADGKVAAVRISGGTFLDYAGERRVRAVKGACRAKVISARDGELLLSQAEDWPVGEAWRGRTVRVDFPFGARREAFEIDRIERTDAGVRVVLAGAPFFTYHRGKVLGFTGNGINRANQFSGTLLWKGGQTTRYMSGCRLEVPEAGFVGHLDRADNQVGHDTERLSVVEDVDLQAAGLKPGMDYLVCPEWYGATADVMQEASLTE